MFLEDVIMSLATNTDVVKRSDTNYLGHRAFEVLSARKTSAMTLPELCTLLNAPARSIQRGFKKIYGTSPLDYHSIYRLNCVRNYLMQNATEQGELTALSRYYGFNHLGRFSKHYKELFGVLPSQDKASSNASDRLARAN